MIVSSITLHTAPQGTAEAFNIKAGDIDQGHYSLPVCGKHEEDQLQASDIPRPNHFFRVPQDLSETEP